MNEIEKALTEAAQKYRTLRNILDAAYERAASGKGAKRHGNSLPFDEQPIAKLQALYGIGGPLFQVGKKMQEALGMLERGELKEAEAELLDGIVYLSGAILHIRSLPRTCPNCEGKGYDPKHSPDDARDFPPLCRECNGTGEVCG